MDKNRRFIVLDIDDSWCCTYQIPNSLKEVTVAMRSGSILLCAALLVAPTASFLNGAIPRQARSGKYLFPSDEDDLRYHNRDVIEHTCLFPT